MKKWMLTLVILILIFISSIPKTIADDPYDPPTMIVELPGSITPNSDISIKVNVVNTTGTRMWRSKVFIDTSLIPTSVKNYLQFYDTEAYLTQHLEQQGFKDVLYPDEEVTVSFHIKASSETPALTIPIYIVLETEIGLCEEGCAPYRRTIQYYTSVIRDEPNLFLSLEINQFFLNVGDCYIARGSFNIPYEISNTSQITAFDIELSVVEPSFPMTSLISPNMPISNIKAGEERRGSILVSTGNLSPGPYPVIISLKYEDYYGKEFELTATFNIFVISDAYELYLIAEEYLESCDYANAKSYYQEARNEYDNVGFEEYAEKCEKKIEKIEGTLLYTQAQELYYSNALSAAKEAYELAELHFQNADDCNGIALCEKGSAACAQGLLNEDSTASTQNGGFSNLELTLLVIVIVLLGVIIILVMRR